MFIDKLIDKIKKTDNPTVMGLDPKFEYIPDHIKKEMTEKYGLGSKAAAKAVFKFNKKLIDSVCDIIPAVKPQLAYYEMYGIEGLKVFKKTIEYAQKKKMLVIADGKRNDIGSTCEAYSTAFLGEAAIEDQKEKIFDADALTVNPYLGADGIKPFLTDCSRFGKGIFVLVKTSNKSSNQLQDLKLEDGKMVYQFVADLVKEWGSDLIGKYGYSSVGAVVGATWPEQAKELRERMESAYFLVPGYGAQGGTAADAAVNFDKDGLGAIVNASRSLMCAYIADQWKKEFSEKEFDLACREEAIRMREELNSSIY